MRLGIGWVRWEPGSQKEAVEGRRMRLEDEIAGWLIDRILRVNRVVPDLRSSLFHVLY